MFDTRVKKCIVVIVLLCIMCLGLLVACDNKNENDNHHKEDFVLYNPITILSEFDADITGSISQMRPVLRFASKNEVNKIELTDCKIERQSGIESHSVTVDFVRNRPDYSKIINGYYVYALPIECRVEAIGVNPTDEKILCSDFEFDIDGRHVTLKTKYYLELFSSKTFIDNSSVRNTIATETGFTTAVISAKQDIEIVGVSFVSEGIELMERVFRDSQPNEQDDFFFDLPTKLSKGERYEFSFTAKNKNGVDCASSYFVLEYKTEGDDTIKRTPFASMHLMDNVFAWEQSL